MKRVSVALLVLLTGKFIIAAQTVTITLPAALSFLVTNVSAGTSSSPATTSIIYSAASLNTGRVIRISVRGTATNFTGPGTPDIPAAKVSWTVSNVTNGTGADGTLSGSAYTIVYQGNGAASGRIDLTWTLAAPGTPLFAGTHTATLRWRVDAVVP